MRRADATARLRAVRASRSPRELIASLNDPSPEVARAAIGRLVELEGPRSADALRARLLDADLSLVADCTLKKVIDWKVLLLESTCWLPRPPFPEPLEQRLGGHQRLPRR